MTTEQKDHKIKKITAYETEQTIWEALNHLLATSGRGSAGILYLLSKAKVCGYNNMLQSNIEKAFKHCVEVALPRLITIPDGGLYYGKEGIAVMMATTKKSGLVNLTAEQVMLIKKCFAPDGKALDIATGIAGKGIALIQCKDFMEHDEYISLLDHYASEIINLQEEDGSWQCAGELEKVTGFDYGIAGIVYFMLEYCMESGYEDAWLCVTQGLSYLEKWFHNNIRNIIPACLSMEVQHIIVCFLKAYKITGIARYKAIAEKALHFHPAVYAHYNLSIYNGMAGLGEVYLEAYEILQSQEYLEKANWIANLLNHHSLFFI